MSTLAEPADLWPRPRIELEMICPYEAGKPIDEVRRELGLARIIKLASNENPLGPSPRVLETLNRSNLELHVYPDYAGSYLRHDLAARLGLTMEQVSLGAGSSELLRLVAEAYLERGDEALVADVSFPVYADVTRIAGGTPVVVPLDAQLDCDLERMLETVTRRTKLVFLAAPNNPTGRGIPAADVRAFLERLPSWVLCVLDLAYCEYHEEPDALDAARLLEAHPNVVIVRTFSKAYGLAGLRIGYGLASTEVTALLARLRVPFSTSTAAQVAARVALEDGEHVARSVALNRTSLAALRRELAALGLEVHPSEANFVLVDVGRDAEEVFQQLLRRGVIVRPMRHPRLRTCLRITTGTAEQQDMLIGALREVLRETPPAGG